MTDQLTPSRRAGLYDELVDALGRITVTPPVEHRRAQADQVLDPLQLANGKELRTDLIDTESRPHPIRDGP